MSDPTEAAPVPAQSRNRIDELRHELGNLLKANWPFHQAVSRTTAGMSAISVDDPEKVWVRISTTEDPKCHSSAGLVRTDHEEAFRKWALDPNSAPLGWNAVG